MIVWIASFPRSGNSFFRTCLHHYYGIPTYAVYRDRDGKLRNLMGVVSGLPVDEINKPDKTYWIKTHKTNTTKFNPDPECPAICIIRDGRDAYVSYAKHKGQDINELITSGGRDSWGNHIEAWIKRPNVHIIRFEDLIASPKEQLQKAVEFAQPDLKIITNEDPPSFEQLNKVAPEFFRRGIVGSWKDEMDADTEKLFWEQKEHAEAMVELGYG